MSGKKELADAILEGISTTMKCEFERLRIQNFNTNTKGYEYEKVVKDVLSEYLGGTLEFHIRSFILDKDLIALEIMKPSQDEFDVVSTYRCAIPKIVQKVGTTLFIPYDAIAAVFEVKQTMTIEKLKADLGKLSLLSRLPLDEERPPIVAARNVSVNHPLKVLIYYESVVAFETLKETLLASQNYWDIVVVVKDDFTVINGTIGLATLVAGIKEEEKGQPVFLKGNSLLNMILGITLSLTYPLTVHTAKVFLKLMEQQRSQNP